MNEEPTDDEPAARTPAPDALPVDVCPAEIESLTARLAFAYGQAMKHYRNQYGMSAQEAHEKANSWEGMLEWLNQVPARTLDYADLQGLAELNPEASLAKWRELRQEAIQSVRAGVPAAEAVECSTNARPWDRAQFLAIRDELFSEWQPSGATERTLIEFMAQAWTLQMQWTAILVQRMNTPMVEVKWGEGKWQLPHIKEHDATAEAATMIERWNRLFLRNLRALQNLRRVTPVIFAPGSQVNVAAPGGQQLNVNGKPATKQQQRRGPGPRPASSRLNPGPCAGCGDEGHERSHGGGS